jgi:hypothetical protein
MRKIPAVVVAIMPGSICTAWQSNLNLHTRSDGE